MKKGIRIDAYLSENGLSESTDKAKREIIAGWVMVDGETVRIPSRVITGREKISVERPGGDFASRGGEKLQHALKFFNISIKGLIVADLGASTGGFTDCLLQNGAKKAYSIDVGYGILDYRLRVDKRVVVKEKTNVRNLTKEDFDDPIDFVTADLSFISILKVFDKINELFSPADGIILLKPQFEARPKEHHKGVIKEKEDHCNILKRVIHRLLDKGMQFNGLHFSPLMGPAGNIEFLLYFNTGGDNNREKSCEEIDVIIDDVIDEAHKSKFSQR